LIRGRIDGAMVRGGSQGAACDLPGLAARTAQRWRAQGIGGGCRAGSRAAPASVPSNAERRTSVGVARSEELRGVSPKRIVPILAERGVDIGLGATFHRVLGDEGLLRRRSHTKPTTPGRRTSWKAATAPCPLWSWDLTSVPGPVRGGSRDPDRADLRAGWHHT
jgi:hypothetical protein